MPNGEAFAKVYLAFLVDERTTATDRAVYAAAVSALNHRTSSGTVALERICRRSGRSRRTVGRSLQRIAAWGYWTLDRPPNGKWTIALAGTDAAQRLASRATRRRAPDSLEDDAPREEDSLAPNALPGAPATADYLLASDASRSPRNGDAAPRNGDATELRDSLQRKDLDAGSTPNGAGVWVPGPDDPKLFELEDSTPRRGPRYWSSIPNPWSSSEEATG